MAAVLARLAAAPAAEVALVRDGAARAVVVLPAEASAVDKLAAEELSEHVERMSGARLAGVTLPAEGRDGFMAEQRRSGLTPVCLGFAAFPDQARAFDQRQLTEGAFLLSVTPERVLVAGRGEGTLYGVSELLEQLGVRWFMPGELGTVIPARTTVAVDVQETVQSPGFAARHFQMGQPVWQRRLRCGGPQYPSCHGLPGFKGGRQRTELFAAHPEYFALVRGERVPRQACVSKPAVLALVVAESRSYFREHPEATILGMGPDDGGGFCECDACRALDAGDFDPFSAEPSVTDRYVWFFNQVLAGLADEFPTKRVGFYIYHSYMRPPVRVKPDPRLCGAFAPIGLCRIHGPHNPVCAEKRYYQSLVEAWGKLLPADNLWERGYWSNLACPGLPFPIVHRLREQLSLFRRAGVYGWRVETFEHWGTQLPGHWVAAKLMWNPAADVEALLDDFAGSFYGPAAAPMGRYHKLLDAAVRDADCHTGSAWDMPRLYPAPVRRQARALLAEGARLAGPADGAYARRIAMIGRTLDLLEAFIAMMDLRSAGDFTGAQAALERLDAVAAQLTGDDPPMIAAKLYDSYMKRFFRLCTEQGAARASGGNRLAALCADRWEFLLDPARVGETLGWWRADLRGGNWQPLLASVSWSGQGLRYYQGLAWYRQTVRIPAEYAGRRLFLWCGGVDETAKVWLNGQAIGISHGAAFYPFELDATPAVRAGQDNQIVFCVANEQVNELGTGGIVAPVLLYAPAAEATLDNVRDLKPTFP